MDVLNTTKRGFSSTHEQMRQVSKTTTQDLAGAFAWPPLSAHVSRLGDTRLAGDIYDLTYLAAIKERFVPAEPLDAVVRLLTARCHAVLDQTKDGMERKLQRLDALMAVSTMVKLGAATPELLAASRILNDVHEARRVVAKRPAMAM